jgi:hypothetical protein
MDDHQLQIQKVIEQEINPIDELFLLNEVALKKIKTIHPTTQYELKKYYPSAWQIFDDKHKSLVFKVTLSNIKRGVKMNLYRSEINPKIMAKIFAENIDIVFNGVVFNSETSSFSDVFYEYMTHYIHGIINENGKVYFLQNLNKNL